MKIHLIIFAILIAGFAFYNLFFVLPDERMHTLVNIIYSSILFGYISFVAFVVLRKMKK